MEEYHIQNLILKKTNKTIIRELKSKRISIGMKKIKTNYIKTLFFIYALICKSIFNYKFIVFKDTKVYDKEELTLVKGNRKREEYYGCLCQIDSEYRMFSVTKQFVKFHLSECLIISDRTEKKVKNAKQLNCKSKSKTLKGYCESLFGLVNEFGVNDNSDELIASRSLKLYLLGKIQSQIQKARNLTMKDKFY